MLIITQLFVQIFTLFLRVYPFLYWCSALQTEKPWQPLTDNGVSVRLTIIQCWHSLQSERDTSRKVVSIAGKRLDNMYYCLKKASNNSQRRWCPLININRLKRCVFILRQSSTLAAVECGECITDIMQVENVVSAVKETCYWWGWRVVFELAF